jgi:hypothetical protein
MPCVNNNVLFDICILCMHLCGVCYECLYVQVEAKAATFGWQSNNIGEIGQGRYLDFMRNLHPTDFIAELLQKTYVIINKMTDKYVIWRRQDKVNNETKNLVPHGVKLYLERNERASTCTVTRIGNGGVVTMPNSSGSMSQFRSKRVVDLDNRTCTCGLWNVDQFPCACAIAVAVSLGKVASVFVATNCHHSYFIQDTGLLAISKGLKPLLALNVEETSQAPDGSNDGNANVYKLLPPPKRTKETHGKNKRKRKESSQKGFKNYRQNAYAVVC